jgi:hypothetical protein
MKNTELGTSPTGLQAQNHLVSALKSSLVPVFLPFLEGPGLRTGTEKNRKKPVVTSLGKNTFKRGLYRPKPDIVRKDKL